MGGRCGLLGTLLRTVRRGRTVPTSVQSGPWRMRAFLWTIAALVAVLGFVGIVAWLNYDGPQLGRPIMIKPKSEITAQHSPEASNFRMRDRVFHKTFGHGTVVATDGPKLTIEFDDGGVKQVLDGFVVRSNEGGRKTVE